MRQKLPGKSLAELCALFGISRQAYYLAHQKAAKTNISHMVVLGLVAEFRAAVPMLGTRKLLHMLGPELMKHDIKMGRDQLFELLRFHGLLMRRRKRYVKTTNSHHWLKRYPNLTKDMLLTASEQLWVSDITYIRTLEGFSYLSLITDAYSRKIVGYALHPNLEASGCIAALNIAIESRKRESPFSPQLVYKNHKEAKDNITQIIANYNSRRPYASLDYLTPEQAHGISEQLNKRWKQYPYVKNGKDEELLAEKLSK